MLLVSRLPEKIEGNGQEERPRKRRRWVEEKEPGRGSDPLGGKQEEEATLRKAEAAPRGKTLCWLIALM